MRKFISKEVQINADNYVGHKGELWVSEDNTILRVGNNTTAGGVEIGVGSASGLSNGNAKVSLSPDGTVMFPDGGSLIVPNDIVPDEIFDTPGTYQWTCPDGVTSVSVVCIGGGAGGSDTSGDGSQGGGDSWFMDPSVVAGLGAPGYSNSNGGIGGGYVGDGGGNGGASGNALPGTYPVGGGGAGGYYGDGGKGADYNGSGTAGEGGAGGGGGGEYENTGGGGGGVGLYGLGQSGAPGSFGYYGYPNFIGSGGGGGSGGEAGGPAGQDYGSAGGKYGGGGGSGIGYWEGGGGGGLGWKNDIAVVPGETYTVRVGVGGTALNVDNGNAGNGGHGAVRIIWGGSSENQFSFPVNAGYALTLDRNGITFPLGGTIATNIVELQNIGPVPTVDIRPYSLDPNQRLRIYPTVAEGNHIHLTSGNLAVTDIFLGDDNQYVRTGADGNVAVGVNGGEVWGGNAWVFGKDGTLHLPANNVGALAFNGQLFKIVTAPSTSKGAAGDIAGTVAFNSSYFYYCTTSYTNGVADIWKRTAWSNDTW